MSALRTLGSGGLGVPTGHVVATAPEDAGDDHDGEHQQWHGAEPHEAERGEQDLLEEGSRHTAERYVPQLGRPAQDRGPATARFRGRFITSSNAVVLAPCDPRFPRNSRTRTTNDSSLTAKNTSEAFAEALHLDDAPGATLAVADVMHNPHRT